jgi:ribosomal protein S18 acetylase RimI-like enzyme
MNITYKKADKNDVPVIAALADSIWRSHYISIISMEQIEYMLKKMYSEQSLLQQMEEGHVFTLILLDGVPSGYISLSSKNGEDYFLHKFYMSTSLQGKGLGTKLFQHITDSLKGAKTVELTVNRKNFTAINFYFKNGFTIKETADFDIGNGYFMNDFVMIKKLG